MVALGVVRFVIAMELKIGPMVLTNGNNKFVDVVVVGGGGGGVTGGGVDPAGSTTNGTCRKPTTLPEVRGVTKNLRIEVYVPGAKLDAGELAGKLATTEVVVALVTVN